MQKPSYKIKIGTETFDSDTSQDIVSINIDLDINIPSDSFKFVIQSCPKVEKIKNGDTTIIEMGYENSLNKILTGIVEAIEPKIAEVTIKGLSIVSILTKQKINQIYEKQTAGAIIKDLANRSGISVKDIEDGLNFPMYVIDDTKNVYNHMRELAKKCGFDIFLFGDGRLNFKKYIRQTPRPFKYGRDIIEAEGHEPISIATCVKVYGESPSSFKGSDKSHWITKRVVEGIAGSGDNVIVIEDPSVKDKDTADKVANSFLEMMIIPLTGTIKSLGNSGIGLGDTIEIKEMPDKRINGEFEVTSISHVFNKTEGFTSTFGWIKKISISSTEPPLEVKKPTMSKPSPFEDQLEDAKKEKEKARLKLIDAIEDAEMELENLLTEINNAVAEMNKNANEMRDAADNARKQALKGAKDIQDKAEELKKNLDAEKKKIEKETNIESQKKIEEYEKQIDDANKKAENMKKEADEKYTSTNKNIEDSKKASQEKLETIKKAYNDARQKVLEARKTVGLE